MDIFIEVAVALISALGLLAGYIVSRLAKEEIKPGERYFHLTGLVVILVFSVLLITFSKWFFIPSLIVVLLYIKHQKLAAYAAYALFACTLPFVNLYAAGVLVFIFGLIQAALFKYPRRLIFMGTGYLTLAVFAFLIF